MTTETEPRGGEGGKKEGGGGGSDLVRGSSMIDMDSLLRFPRRKFPFAEQPKPQSDEFEIRDYKRFVIRLWYLGRLACEVPAPALRKSQLLRFDF